MATTFTTEEIDDCAAALGIDKSIIDIVAEGDDIEYIEFNPLVHTDGPSVYGITDGVIEHNLDNNPEKFGEFKCTARDASYVIIASVKRAVDEDSKSIKYADKRFVILQLIVVEGTPLAVVQAAAAEHSLVAA